MQIEHNPNEKRMTNTIWWIVWPLVALAWVWYLYFVGGNWPGVMLGAFSGMVLATFALEVSGNKAPGSR
jgi:hypothetical protein